MCFDRENNRQITEYPLYLHEDEKGNSEIIGRKGRKVRRVELGGGMPEGGAPYQQLVTDGEGNAKWEDRLAYETVRKKEIVLTFDPAVNTESFIILRRISSDIIPPDAFFGKSFTVRNNRTGEETRGFVEKTNMTDNGDGTYTFVLETADGIAQFMLNHEANDNLPVGVFVPYSASTSAYVSELHAVIDEHVMKPIDPKFLPGAMVVNYTSGSDGTVTADKTFDEIMTAIKAGSSVEARNSNGMLTEVYGLNMFTDGVISFIYMAYDPESGTTNAKVIAHMQGDTIVPAAGVV